MAATSKQARSGDYINVCCVCVCVCRYLDLFSFTVASSSSSIQDKTLLSLVVFMYVFPLFLHSQSSQGMLFYYFATLFDGVGGVIHRDLFIYLLTYLFIYLFACLTDWWSGQSVSQPVSRSVSLHCCMHVCMHAPSTVLTPYIVCRCSTLAFGLDVDVDIDISDCIALFRSTDRPCCSLVIVCGLWPWPWIAVLYEYST